ncbi:MAG: YlxR family protein [Oscillospiraceae bacterium]|nr:YlxR family protein [Oscillospiraceae bacterium]
MQQKKIPQRQCMGCRERKEKRELIRVVRAPDGGVSLDFRGKAPGRGAYICPEMACLKKAIRSKALERSLEVPIPEEIYARLEQEMEEGKDA